MWPGSPIIDGRFYELLTTYTLLLEELGMLLHQAEDAAAAGRGVSDLPEVHSTSRAASPVEARLNTSTVPSKVLTPEGEIKRYRVSLMADDEVRAYRTMKNKWRKRLNELVEEAEVDLGKRAPRKGPRDRFGKLKILSAGMRESYPDRESYEEAAS